MEDLCIFTPTYNRAYVLPRLFDSLRRQSKGGFQWLIVDDGSTDDTEQLVRSFQEADTPFPIRYIKQTNGGKQRAHNTAVEACGCELFMCIDSDDLLVDDAVKSLMLLWETCRHHDSIAGIVALCGTDAHTPLQNEMPHQVKETSLWNLYYKRGHKGDVTLVYRTEILKQYPFFVHENEKFMAETYVYHQIDEHYQLAVMNKILSVKEYLPDGYSKNVRQVTKKNPHGYVILKRMFIGYSDTLYLKFYNTMLYLVGCRLCNMKGSVIDAPVKVLALLAYFPAWILCKTVYR